MSFQNLHINSHSDHDNYPTIDPTWKDDTTSALDASKEAAITNGNQTNNNYGIMRGSGNENYYIPDHLPPPYSYPHLYTESLPIIETESLMYRSTNPFLNPFNIHPDIKSGDHIGEQINLYSHNYRIIKMRGNYFFEIISNAISTQQAFEVHLNEHISPDIDDYYFKFEERSLLRNGLPLIPEDINITSNNHYEKYRKMMNKNNVIYILQPEPGFIIEI